MGKNVDVKTIVNLPKVSNCINPNFIYNRFDLHHISENKFQIFKIELEGKVYFIEAYYEDNEAILGIWLSDIPEEVVIGLINFIFDTHDEINKISYTHSYLKLGLCTEKNHFRIKLPDKIEELDKRTTSKERYNIRSRKKKINDNIGECKFEEYTADNVTNEIFEKYFYMKEKTFGRDYKMSAEEYIQAYHITDIYVMKANEDIMSIILSCEQCPIAYIENITYNLEYKNYFPGMIIYDYYIHRLVEKHKSELFLGGGPLDFKRKYGSIEENIYEGIIYKNKFKMYFKEQAHKVSKFIKHLTKD